MEPEEKQQQPETAKVGSEVQQRADKEQPDVPQQTMMSKSQMKKLKKREMWEQTRQQRKELQKQKKKEKKMNQQTKQVTMMKQQLPVKKRKEQYLEKLAKGLRVVIDLQFFDKMTEKEQNTPTHDILTKKYNADHWGIKIVAEHFMELFKKQEIVYLTGDAQEELETFEEDKVYIIGGLVDHNRMKKITYNFALEEGIKMAKFPLGRYVELKTNCHLAVNHVFQMVLRVYNGQSWKDTIKQTIPSRKIIEKEQQ